MINMPNLAKIKLRTINNLLTISVVLLNFYIIALPLMPQFTFWWKSWHNKGEIPYSGNLAKSIGSPDTKTTVAPIPDENRIVIPALSLNEKIFEGDSVYTVNKGVWRRPATSSPELGGNTVLVGHRFTYKDPAVFYHLDKVNVGDKLAVYWNKKEYIYEVSEVKVVAATAISIEENTPDSKLTIYTCTPLWSAKDRLVVIAFPINGEKS